MVVGFRNDSDSDSAGSSIGKPPAIRMPRLTSSTRLLKCIWQGCASDQVLRIAMAEGPDIVGRKPARAAERFRSFFLVCHGDTCTRPRLAHLTGGPCGASP